jgi:hypothetical protein
LFREENEWQQNTLVFLVARPGREFDISPSFGIAVDVGIMVLVSEQEKVKKERPTT